MTLTLLLQLTDDEQLYAEQVPTPPEATVITNVQTDTGSVEWPVWADREV